MFSLKKTEKKIGCRRREKKGGAFFRWIEVESLSFGGGLLLPVALSLPL
jgi:hypothetical protein